MKASELILNLQAIIHLYGDRDIQFTGECNSSTRVGEITVDTPHSDSYGEIGPLPTDGKLILIDTGIMNY